MSQGVTEGAALSPAEDFESYCPPNLRIPAAYLATLLYKDLRKMARRERFRMPAGSTFCTTALVNEVFVRLSGNLGFESQDQFLRIAAIAMRRTLVDRVREQLAQKRGKAFEQVPLEEADGLIVEDEDLVSNVHEALKSLASFAPRLSDIVVCRFFGGYGEAETAKALGISERTVRRDWLLAKAWLLKELGESAESI